MFSFFKLDFASSTLKVQLKECALKADCKKDFSTPDVTRFYSACRYRWVAGWKREENEKNKSVTKFLQQMGRELKYGFLRSELNDVTAVNRITALVVTRVS